MITFNPNAIGLSIGTGITLASVGYLVNGTTGLASCTAGFGLVLVLAHLTPKQD